MAHSIGLNSWTDSAESALTKSEYLTTYSKDCSPTPASSSGRSDDTSLRTSVPRSSRRWQDEAACKGMGVSFFIPEIPLTPLTTVLVARAKAVCATCPVTEECRRYATRNNASGVWGGVLLVA